jgi:hypothetical protein
MAEVQHKGWWKTWWVVVVIVIPIATTVIGGLILWGITRYFDRPTPVLPRISVSPPSPSVPIVKTPKPTPQPPSVKVDQHGNGNGAVGGNITTAPCSNVQIGGNNNQATVNCAPAERHLTDDQKAKLASLLKAESPQEFYFLCAPDAESTYFANEILSVLESVGWKPVQPPDNWGTIERQGVGVSMLVRDMTAPVPRAGVALQQALKEIGIDAPGVNFPMAPNDKITLYVGVRPPSSGTGR